MSAKQLCQNFITSEFSYVRVVIIWECCYVRVSTMPKFLLSQIFCYIGISIMFEILPLHYYVHLNILFGSHICTCISLLNEKWKPQIFYIW